MQKNVFVLDKNLLSCCFSGNLLDCSNLTLSSLKSPLIDEIISLLSSLVNPKCCYLLPTTVHVHDGLKYCRLVAVGRPILLRVSRPPSNVNLSASLQSRQSKGLCMRSKSVLLGRRSPWSLGFKQIQDGGSPLVYLLAMRSTGPGEKRQQQMGKVLRGIK